MSFPSSIVSLKKDTTHSCVFDWPDRPVRPTPPVGPPPLYPYDPIDDWNPFNPLDNGMPGSFLIQPSGPFPLPNLLYAKINTDHASFSTIVSINFTGTGMGSLGFSYATNPPPSPLCFCGGAKAAPNTGEARCFADFANYQNSFGVHADCSGQISCDYDHTVSGNTILSMDFWLYENVSLITEGTLDWVFAHTGFTYGGHFQKTVRGFPFSDVFILEYHYHDLDRTITFGYD